MHTRSNEISQQLINGIIQIHLGSNVVANLFNAKFYTVEKFTIGHVSAHGAADSFTCASVYAHAQLSDFSAHAHPG